MADETDWEEGPNIFEKYRVDIVKSIDTDKQFMFSYLRSNSVLDEEDCERISHGITRKEKVAKMLDILGLKGPDAIQHFVRAVEFEHPKLYEKITGKKAHSDFNPGSADGKDGLLNSITGLDGKALIDFDREFLAKQLDRAMTDLKCMTYWQSKMLKEKNNLEQKLFEATDDLQMKDKNMNDLQEQIIQFTAEMRAEATEEDSLKTDQPMQLYLQELWRDNMERSNVIIALQGRLLVANEQVEDLRKANAELERKNDDFKNQVRKLTIVYDHERRNSRKLNETMMSQTNETDVLKKEILKWKYDYSCLLEEKDILKTELANFQKWAEILNARFDIVTQEKEELEENSEDLCSRFRSAQLHCEKIEAKMKWMEFSNERFTIEGDRLKATIESLRKNRSSLNAAREAAILSRNEALKEKAKIENTLQELQLKHDDDVDHHIRLYEELESNHCKTLKDIAEMHEQFAEKEKELQEIKDSLAKRRPSSATDLTIDKDSKETTPDEEKEEDQTDSCSTTTSVSVFKQKRSRKDLIESIRRKVSQDAKPRMNKGGTLPANFKSAAIKGYLDYEQLSLIYPQQLSKPCGPMSEVTGLCLNIPDAMAYNHKSLPPRISPSSMLPFAFEKITPKRDDGGDAQPSTGIKKSTDLRGSLRKMKQVVSEDSNEPFRHRLYCMDPKGKITDNRTRSVSSPPNISNEISTKKLKKASST